MSQSDPSHSYGSADGMADHRAGADADRADRAVSGWEPSSAELARRADAELARQAPPTSALTADPQVGTAYAVGIRSESYGRESGAVTVLTFRLRRYDPAGQELPPVSVEMRGRILHGTVSEGDQIRLPAPVAGGGLQLKSVQNLTTGTAVSVRATSAPAWVGITLMVLILAVFVVFAIVVVGGIASTALR